MIGKVVTTWAGTSGGPGINQLYMHSPGQTLITTTQAQSAVNAVRAFWASVAPYLPDEVQLVTQPVIDMYDHGNGQLTNTVSAATPPAGVAGTSTAAYTMASGIKMNLQTPDIRNGRRVRGSIFIVPATSGAMNAVGAVAAGTRTTLNTAGGTLVNSLLTAGLELIVWGRPVKDDAGVITRQGTVNRVMTIDTAEKACILRGRRD